MSEIQIRDQSRTEHPAWPAVVAVLVAGMTSGSAYVATTNPTPSCIACTVGLGLATILFGIASGCLVILRRLDAMSNN